MKIKSEKAGDREVGCSRACVGKPPHDPVGGDHSAGPLRGTEAGCGAGPAHSDDTCRGAL